MPVYEYEGTHYDLPDGLTDEQAKQKILAHLGQGKQPQLENRVGRLFDGQRLLDEQHQVVEQAIQDPNSVLDKFSNPVANVFGMAEQIPAGAQALGSVIAGGLGGVAGALIPGDSAQEGFTRSADAFTKGTSLLTPRTDPGQAITGLIAAGVEKVREAGDFIANQADVNRPGSAASKNVDHPGRDVMRGIGSLVRAGPELAMTVPLLGRGKKGKTDKPVVEDKKKPAETYNTEAIKKATETQTTTKRLDINLDEGPTGHKAGGAEPIFVDPQGQAFRSQEPARLMQDPLNESRLGLERQTEAFENAAKYNEWGESAEGQPLPLLTRESLESSREGPYASPLQAAVGKSTGDLARLKAEDHPFVLKAQERVDRATEMLLKAQDLQQSGKATAAQVKRAERDLAEFERRLQKTLENVEDSYRQNKGVEPKRWNKQKGAINPAVFTDGFDQIKKLANGYRLRANYDDRFGLRIFVLDKDGVIQAHTKFDPVVSKKNSPNSLAWSSANKARAMPDAFDLASSDTHTNPEVRRMGMATEIYKFARELKNDIRRGYTTNEGSAMWQGWRDKGFATPDDTIPRETAAERFARVAREESKKEAKTHIGRMFGGKQDGAIRFEGFEQEAFGLHNWLHVRMRQILGQDQNLTDYKGNQFHVESYDWEYPNKVRAATRLPPRLMLEVRDENGDVTLKSSGYFPALNKLDNELFQLYQEESNAPMIDHKGARGPRGQRGMINLGSDKKNQAEALNKMPWAKRLGSFAPSLLTPDEAIKQALKEQDISDGWLKDNTINQLTKGGQYYKDRHPNNTLIRFSQERIMEADRLGRADTAQWVHDFLTPKMRVLDDAQLTAVWDVIDHADLVKKEPLRESMVENGFTPEMIDLVDSHRKAMDYAFKAANQIRAAAGKEPIDRRVAYAAMRSTGDFRALVLDKKGGDIVGVIGSNRRAEVLQLQKKTQEKGLYVDPIKYFGGVPKDRGSANQAFQHAMQFLAENDPRMQQFLDVLDSIYKDEAYSYMNRKTHMLDKKGVPGMTGRKDWKTAYENAKEGMEAQVTYLESILKWRRLMEAVEEVSPLLKNPDISQPKAKQWVEDYMKQALGFNPSKVGAGLERAVAEAFEFAPVGYSVVRKGQAVARQVTNATLLALDPMFWLINEVQPLRSMPAMTAALEARGGLPFNPTLGYNMLGKAVTTVYKKRDNSTLSPIERGAYDYAQSHHVYGSDLVEHSNRVRKDVAHIANQTSNWGASQIESHTRELMFMAFVHMLDKHGMKPKDGLYETAHNAVDMTMNNYSTLERPRLYNTLGPAGDISANLQSFKHNEISRVMMYARMGMTEKQWRPFVTEMMTSLAFAGVIGTVAFQEADALIKFLSTKMGHPTSLTKLVLDSVPEIVSHGGFSMMGVDLSKRLGMGNTMADTPLDALFPGSGKLVDIAKAWGKVLVSPSEMNLKRAITETAPRPVAGNLDRAWFSSNQQVVDPEGIAHDVEVGHSRNDLEAKAYRNEADKAWKTMGATGINEALQKDRHYEESWVDNAYKELRTKALEKMAADIFTNSRPSPKNVKAYLDAQGDLETLEQDLNRIKERQSVPEHVRVMLQKAISARRPSQESAKRRANANQ